ncbi:ORF3 [Grizzly bear anellovirus 10]|nr:ORF3 [Grizzly bear anellovirus 10]
MPKDSILPLTQETQTISLASPEISPQVVPSTMGSLEVLLDLLQSERGWRDSATTRKRKARKPLRTRPTKKPRTRVPRDPSDPWGSSTDAEIEWSDGSDDSFDGW